MTKILGNQYTADSDIYKKGQTKVVVNGGIRTDSKTSLVNSNNTIGPLQLTQDGDLRTLAHIFDNNMETTPHISHFGALKTSGTIPIIDGNFPGDKFDESIWENRNYNGGYFIIHNGICDLNTGPHPYGSGKIISREEGIFIPGQVSVFQSGVYAGNEITNSFRRWGLIKRNESNGLFFEWASKSFYILKCHVRSATSTTVTLTNEEVSINNFYNDDYEILIVDGNGVGQNRKIIDYDGVTKTVTVEKWKKIPDETSKYIIGGYVKNATGTTIMLPNSESSVDDYYNGYMIIIYSGRGEGEKRIISNYIGSTRTAIVPTWFVTPDSSSKYFMFKPVVSASATTVTLSSNESNEDNAYDNCDILITTGSGAGQYRQLSNYNGSTKTADVLEWNDIPNENKFQIVARRNHFDTAVSSKDFNGEVWIPNSSNNIFRIHFSESQAFFQRSKDGNISTLHRMTNDDFPLSANLNLGMFFEVCNLGNPANVGIKIRDSSNSVFGNLKNTRTKYLYKTTNNLVVTTIDQESGISSSDTTFTISSPFGLAVNNYIKIDDEYLLITDVVNNDITVTRGHFYTTPTTHSNGSYVKECFATPINVLSGYNQLQFELFSDQNMTSEGFWYNSSIASFNNLVRTFTLPYSSSEELVSNTFPCLTEYLQYIVYPNTASTSTFLYGLKISDKAFSAQTLPVEGFISTAMSCELDRSITVGKQPNGLYVNLPADGQATIRNTILANTHIVSTISTNDTSIVLSDSSSFPDSGTIIIDDEEIEYTNISGNTLIGCIRGVNNTVAMNHNNESIVREIYLSEWVNSNGWNCIEIFLASDVESAHLGIQVELTSDLSNPVIEAKKSFSYRDRNLEKGYQVIRFIPILNGYRIKYIPNETPQSIFKIISTLKTNSDTFSLNDGRAIETTDFNTEVALGNIPSYSSDTKFGRNEKIAINRVPEDVWENGGLYTGHPIDFTPEIVKVKSTSNNDKSNGNGARTIQITGLKSENSSKYESEIITLNGKTNVNSVNSWWRINRAKVLTAGLSGENEGTIRITSSGIGQPLFATIEPSFNQTNLAIYTVPNKTKMIIKSIVITSSTISNIGRATIVFKVRKYGEVFQNRNTFDIQTGSIYDLKFITGIVVESKSDLKFQIKSVSENSIIVNVNFEFILLDL